MQTPSHPHFPLCLLVHLLLAWQSFQGRSCNPAVSQPSSLLLCLLIFMSSRLPTAQISATLISVLKLSLKRERDRKEETETERMWTWALGLSLALWSISFPSHFCQSWPFTVSLSQQWQPIFSQGLFRDALTQAMEFIGGHVSLYWI